MKTLLKSNMPMSRIRESVFAGHSSNESIFADRANGSVAGSFDDRPKIVLSLLDKHTRMQLKRLQQAVKNYFDRYKSPAYRKKYYNVWGFYPDQVKNDAEEITGKFLNSHPVFANKIGLCSSDQYADFMRKQAAYDKDYDHDDYVADVDGGLGTMDGNAEVYMNPLTSNSTWIGDDDADSAYDILIRLHLVAKDGSTEY